MVLRILPVLFLTLILSDLYIYYTDIKKLRVNKYLKLAFFIPNVIIIAMALILTFIEDHSAGNMQQMMFFFSVYLLIAIPKTVYMLTDIIRRIVAMFWNKSRKTGKIISITLGIIFFGIILTGITYGPSNVKVRNENFYSEDLPEEFEGYKILHFTDMHLSSFRNRKHLVNNIVNLITEQNPDLIVFTGDLVSSDAYELEEFKNVLCKLKAPDGVVSVLGNHDYMNYARFLDKKGREEHFEKFIETQRNMGWQLLMNENLQIRKGNDSIGIIGVENIGNNPIYIQKGDLKKAMQGINSNSFNVLLSHDPTHWYKEVTEHKNIQLTLSGHTHGMQFMIFGWSPAQWIYPEWKHWYHEKNQALYISLGVGGALIPFRFGAWPEISVITLHSKEKKNNFALSYKK